MAAGKGGARPGAGRPRGSTTSANSAAQIRTRITEQHAAIKDDKGRPLFSEEVAGSDPLSTIELYRKVHLQDFENTGDIAALKEAMSAAREAAPYSHAKRQSIVQENINVNPAEAKTDAELMGRQPLRNRRGSWVGSPPVMVAPAQYPDHVHRRFARHRRQRRSDENDHGPALRIRPGLTAMLQCGLMAI